MSERQRRKAHAGLERPAPPVDVILEAGIARVVLNRPERMNALDLPTLNLLGQRLTDLGQVEGLKGVVITGAGEAFCAGGDLAWTVRYPGRRGAALRVLSGKLNLAVLEIRSLPVPVVAAVNGAAAGGGLSLALACDFRVMARSAKLKLAYPSVGLCMDGGGSFMLPRLAGLARAMEIAAFDAPIPAEQALAWGLVNRVAEDGEAVDEAVRLVEAAAKGSLHAFAWSKRLMNESLHAFLAQQMEREREGIAACAEHPEGREGVDAFLENRRPGFGGGG